MSVFLTQNNIPPSSIMLDQVANYDPVLVATSYALAVFGSFMAMAILNSLNYVPQGQVRKTGMLLGAVVMACAIWSMHYTGMLAYNMEMIHHYNLMLTAVSGCVAIVFALGVFYILTRQVFRLNYVLAGAPLLGLGVATMHYAGMAAMEVKADIFYKQDLFIFSILIAVSASAAALWIMHHVRQSDKYQIPLQILAALVMGIAVCGMHYTGMAATIFVPYADCRFNPDQDYSRLSIGVVFTACLVMGTASGFLLYIRKYRKPSTSSEFWFLSRLQYISMALKFIFMVCTGLTAMHLYSTLQALEPLPVSALKHTRDLSLYYQEIINSAQNQTHLMLLLLLPGLTMLVIGFISLGQGKKLLTHAMWERNFSQNIMDAIPDPIFVKNSEHVWQAGNQAFWRLMGGRPEQYIGKNDHDLFPPEEAAIFWEKDDLVIRTGAIDINEENVTGADGITMVALTTKSPLEMADGKRGLVGIIHDISALKRAEIELEHHRDNLQAMVDEQVAIINEERENLRIAKDAAETANIAKSDFLANMSHELRTPLNSILGMAQLLINTKLSRNQQEMVEIMMDSSANLLEIVDDILDISKIETGNLQLEAIAFSPMECTARVVNMLTPVASKKGLVLTLHIRDQAAEKMTGDPVRFMRIVTNLVGNAIKYTEQGKVDAYLSSVPLPGGQTLFRVDVVDTGIGIPADKLTKVFEKFTQADTSTTRKYGGSGLGLTITRELVEMMQGTISVESTLGVGSKFSVSIPFTNASEQEVYEASGGELGYCGIIPADTVKILIAEDHLLNQVYMKKLLPTLGIKHFTIVPNGREAVKAALTNEFDIVLMDCHMPELNGYDATQEIRKAEQETEAHIPIIAMTANAMIGERERCLECGMDEYISKPVSHSQLQNILSHWINFRAAAKIAKPKKQQEASELSTLDLTILRTFSEGDKEVEREFAEIFVEQSQLHLQKLSAFCISGESQEWKEAAHLLKGGSATMGAMKMRAFCAEAQEMLVATKKSRQAILKSINQEFAEVCNTLQEMELIRRKM